MPASLFPSGEARVSSLCLFSEYEAWTDLSDMIINLYFHFRRLLNGCWWFKKPLGALNFRNGVYVPHRLGTPVLSGNTEVEIASWWLILPLTIFRTVWFTWKGNTPRIGVLGSATRSPTKNKNKKPNLCCQVGLFNCSVPQFLLGRPNNYKMKTQALN